MTHSIRPLLSAVAAIALADPSVLSAARPVRHRVHEPSISLAPEPGGTFQYKVQPGDTLRSIVYDYFANPSDKTGYQTIWKLNHVKDPGRLTVGASLNIPRRFLSVVSARALVGAFRGAVMVNGTRQVHVNTVLTEGARITTGPDASVSLTLEDGSTVSLPSQSTFVLERLRLVLISGELEHVFRLEQGRSQFVVSPARGPVSRFQVKTPVSVSAVRGTEFRVEVDDTGKASLNEVLKDNVAVSPLTGGNDLDVKEGFGVKSDVKGVGTPAKLLPYPEVILPVFHHPDGSLTFNVHEVDGALHYRLQIATDLTFQDVREEALNDKPTFNVKSAPVGNYYIRLTAIDSQGLEGLQHIYPFAYAK